MEKDLHEKIEAMVGHNVIRVEPPRPWHTPFKKSPITMLSHFGGISDTRGVTPSFSLIKNYDSRNIHGITIERALD